MKLGYNTNYSVSKNKIKILQYSRWEFIFGQCAQKNTWKEMKYSLICNETPS